MAFWPPHVALATAIGSVLTPRSLWRPFLIAGALCAIAPDLDVVVGIAWRWRGAHRAFTHSLLFAFLTGSAVALILPGAAGWRAYRVRLAFYLMLATASHGVLDALTTVPQGVQFFNPFSSTRVRVMPSPIDSRFTEFWYCLVPFAGFTLAVLIARGVKLPLLERQVPLSIIRD